jgi:hypothetical protein
MSRTKTKKAPKELDTTTDSASITPMSDITTDAPANETEGDDKTPRQETVFRVLSRAKGEELWRVHDDTVTGRTQDEGKKRAAVMLGEREEYAAVIQGDGLELAVTSARSFKPQLVKVEPQPAKVVIR